MKFPISSTVAVLAPLVAATYPPDNCQPVPPTTVTQTVYRTITYHPAPPAHPTPAPLPKPVVITKNGYVTSCDYDVSRTTVWVWPTGSPSHDCTVAIYEHNTVVIVNIVNINVVINNYGQTVTVTSTKTEKPTWTPEPILPPPVTYTHPPYGQNTTRPIYPTSGTGSNPEYNSDTESSLPPHSTASPSTTSESYTKSGTTYTPLSSSSQSSLYPSSSSGSTYTSPTSSSQSSLYPSYSSSSSYVLPSSSSEPYEPSSTSSTHPSNSYDPPSVTPTSPPASSYPTGAVKPSQAPHGARSLEWSA